MLLSGEAQGLELWCLAAQGPRLLGQLIDEVSSQRYTNDDTVVIYSQI